MRITGVRYEYRSIRCRIIKKTYNFSVVYLGKDMDGYIQLLRGLREGISEECAKAGIPVEISD